jgi:hypothetical protein
MAQRDDATQTACWAWRMRASPSMALPVMAWMAASAVMASTMRVTGRNFPEGS